MWNGVVTNLGLSLLEQWAAGSETLYIDKATAGSGTVAQSNMRGSTYVQGEVGDVSIVASIPVTGGTQYRIQVSANPDAAYIMHQIGIWAHLGASGGTTLLALYQDEDGVSVPLEADDPGFGFTLYAVVSMSNQGSVTVNFDGGAYVTRDDFSSALAGYVKTVNENGPNSDGNVTLPVDAVPTSGSTNPVTSGGVYTGLDGKQDKLTLPLAIAQGGTGAVAQEQAIYNLMAYAPYITQYISTEDLNNLTHSGFYQVSGEAANEPNAVPHFVISLTNADGTRRTQFAWRSTGNTTTDSAYTIYMRKYVTDTWGEWRVVRTPGTALTIAEGGTGATTAAAALTNLGIDRLFASGGLYQTMSDLITAIQSYTNNDKLVCGVAVNVLNALTGGSSTLGGIAVILKSSASNAYYFAFNRDEAGYGNINYSSGTASTIHPLVDNAYKAGDTFTTNQNAVFPAVLTAATKTINVTIPLPKSLSAVSSISVTSFKGGARYPGGGYVGNGSASSPWVSSDSFEWVGASGLTIVTRKSSDNLIAIQITSSTAFTAGNTTTALTNNIPINFIATCSLAFS